MVTVRLPGLRTPRIDMHECSASRTTATPGAFSSLSTRFAISCVIRSWTWGLRAISSTTRASLLSPVTWPLGM